MERFGFVGLPNAGKSSLFNALAGGGALVAPYPYSTTTSNLGRGKVPDTRLDRLAAMSQSKNMVHAECEFVDIGGLAAGASEGEGLGNKFLAGIREVDTIVYVLRAFEDGDVVGSHDPMEHLATIELELCLADMTTVDAQLPKKEKLSRLDKTLVAEVAALTAARAELDEGVPLYRSNLSDEQRAILKAAFLLTNKPVLVVVNVAEADLERVDELTKPVVDQMNGFADVLGMCVQLEAEAAQLPEDERAEVLDALGIGEGALPRVVHSAYHLLGRRTFLTTGDKESRAWTFRAGAKAPECAGVIHSDLQRGFIRAEVIRWDELLELGSWSKARDVGKLRVEGKDYEVIDGDVLEIRFNV
jgi:GTP-binding protein YchF